MFIMHCMVRTAAAAVHFWDLLYTLSFSLSRALSLSYLMVGETWLQ